MSDREELATMMGRAAKKTIRRPLAAVPFEPMSREARGNAPVWRTAKQAYPHSFTLPLDDRRHLEMRRLALDLNTSSAIFLRAAIDLLLSRPELVEELRPQIETETELLRRRP